MNNTGEQFIPGISSKRLFDEHVLRYKFAKKFCKGKDVLDIACGTGYGSYEISKTAKSVVGVDISKESIDFANSNYFSDNLRFILGNAIDFKIDNLTKFDVIISFETIEHLDCTDRSIYLNNIKNSLKPNGLFILSTPNKIISSPFYNRPSNKFHFIEFTRDSLEKELAPFFIINDFYGQRFVNSFFTYKIVRFMIRLFEKFFFKEFGIFTIKPSPDVCLWNNYKKQPRIIIITAEQR